MLTTLSFRPGRSNHDPTYRFNSNKVLHSAKVGGVWLTNVSIQYRPKLTRKY